MARFSLIIFDMDGVLADSSPCHARAYQDLWKEIRVEGPRYESIMGRPTGEVIREVTRAIQPTPEQLERWIRFKQERARTYLQKETVTFPDTREVLEKLKAAGTSIAVGTSASRDTAELLLNQIGIMKLIPVLVASDDVREGKPAPDTYLEAMRRSAGSPDQTLVVEDSLSGLKAATAAGTWSAAVRANVVYSGPRFLGNFADLRSLAGQLEDLDQCGE
ncbi:MAG TPA: HAD family phosphatase [Gemmatimonadales bacterium]|jgi:HAD superfamily hydrolase (TIGR01509 family)